MASWFVTVVVASGLAVYLQTSIGMTELPIQTGARGLLVVIVLMAFLAGYDRRKVASVRSLALPILLVATAALLSVTLALLRYPSSQQANILDSFMFMYSIGVLLVLFLLVPLVVRPTLLFKVLVGAAIAFGTAQLVTQDLLLPDAYRIKFGIVDERFANGNIRVVSFFASPPRLAELLVFAAAYLQYELLTYGVRRRGLLLIPYLLVVLVLYGTYSRSGYILFLVVLLIELLLFGRRAQADGARVRGIGRRNAAVAILAAGVVALGAGLLPFDASIADRTSLEARGTYWETIVTEISDGSVADLFFGAGQAAHYTKGEDEYFVVDNLFLALFLYGGLVGLGSVAFLYLALLRAMLRRARARPLTWRPIIAFYIALAVEGLFVDNHNTLFLLQFAILGLLTWDSLTADDRSDTGRCQSVPTVGKISRPVRAAI